MKDGTIRNSLIGIGILLAASVYGLWPPNPPRLPRGGASSLANVPTTDGMAIMLGKATRVLHKQGPASEYSVQKRLFESAPSNERITLELLMTDFKYPCIRLEQEQAAGPGGHTLPPVAMVANHLIVRLGQGTTENQLSEILTSRRLTNLPLNLLMPDIYLIELPLSCTDGSATLIGLQRAFRALKIFTQPRPGAPALLRYVEPNYLYFKNGLSAGGEVNLLWGLHNIDARDRGMEADIHAFEGWERIYESPDIKVAVVDSGIDYVHPDLAPNMWMGPVGAAGGIDEVYGHDYVSNDGDPMDQDGHGTLVAGILGAIGSDGQGVVGVTWKVKIKAYRFIQSWGGAASDAIESINAATAAQVNIIAGSWGSSQTDSQSLRDAIDEAERQNILMVCAAGNGSQDTDAVPFFPASYTSSNIISVTSTNEFDQFPNVAYGATSVDIAAPGTKIYSTSINNGYDIGDGTSMAVPYVAGACALVWQQAMKTNPNVSYTVIRDAILSSRDKLPDLEGKCVTGGRLNLEKALLAASG